MPETVYSILVIDSGVLKYSAVFRNEADAERDILRYMKKEYDDLVGAEVNTYEELVELLEDHGDLDLHFIYEPLL